MFVVVTSFSSQGLALLDVGGKGSAEDREALKLLYTFDEAAGSNTVFNQIEKNNPNHPSHLTVTGNATNIKLEDGQIEFVKNSVQTAREQVYFRSPIGTTVRNEVVTIKDKKAKAQGLFNDRVYLKSKGEIGISSICGSDEEVTVQIFYKPKRINYSTERANMVTLRPLNSASSSFTMSELYGQESVRSNIGRLIMNHRNKDVDYSGRQNETVITFKTGGSYSSYHLIHSEAGKEGWLTTERATGGYKVTNFSNSRLIIGASRFPNGENVGTLLGLLNNATQDSVIKNLINFNTSGYTGSIQQFALYCRNVDQAEVLGGEYTDTTKIKVTPELVGEPTQSEKVAVRLLSLITKKKIPVDAAIVKQAAVHISRGDYKKAAQIGIELPDFYNNTVKDMGLKMSNREETVDVPLNDFTATVIGVVRDQVNAKELLTGNFYYRGNGLVGVPSDVKTHMLQSNTHYEELDKGGYDLKKALIRVDGQKLTGASGAPVDNPDPAGVLTSRAFMAAHSVAGTNRRQVEYTFKQFMCLNLSEVADTEASDLRVGRDIDRFPGGSHKKYQTSCKGCHTVMDGFRGAFAKVDYGTFGRVSYVKHGDLQSINRAVVSGKSIYHPIGSPVKNISYKMNHNDFAFPNGYVTRDDSFYNFANRGANKILLGWRSSLNKGYGIGQFGKMISESERFSKCMVKQVFEAICPVNIDENILSKLSVYVNQFESSGYNLKELFLNASISPLCIGGN